MADPFLLRFDRRRAMAVGRGVADTGLASPAGGILYAMMQPNLKRLLAYSRSKTSASFYGVGLSMILWPTVIRSWQRWGFGGSVHAFNQRCSRTCCFWGRYDSSPNHELNIDMMGGLIKKRCRKPVYCF